MFKIVFGKRAIIWQRFQSSVLNIFRDRFWKFANYSPALIIKVLLRKKVCYLSLICYKILFSYGNDQYWDLYFFLGVFTFFLFFFTNFRKLISYCKNWHWEVFRPEKFDSGVGFFIFPTFRDLQCFQAKKGQNQFFGLKFRKLHEYPWKLILERFLAREIRIQCPIIKIIKLTWAAMQRFQPKMIKI